MTHANAPLTPEGRRRLARLVVEEGWPVRRAAERFQVSPATVSRWVGRYQAGQPLEDRSWSPHHSPGRLARRTERRIIALRLKRRWGPHRIATTWAWRAPLWGASWPYNMPRLTEVDQATGLVVRRPVPVRYEKTSPGELVHLDIKKLGRVPDGGGWRAHGRGSAPALAADRARTRTRRRGGPVGGYRCIHHAIDDYSRVVYSEILDDERKETAAGFFQRANAFFKDLGVTVQAVMTDNGACYRSRAFNQVLSSAGVKYRYTRPYRPQTNGKVERFNRTLAREWAYAHTYTSQTQREAAYQTWLHHYNHHRPHTALDGQTPANRIHNLTRKYT